MNYFKKVCYFVILNMLLLSCDAQDNEIEGVNSNNSIQNSYYLFSYFTGEGIDDGLHLAISNEGRKWTSLNGGLAVFKPEFGKIFRDPCIVQGKDSIFHVVWTVGATEKDNGKVIGIAHSDNLFDWYGAETLVVMDDPNTINCWAPELFWDEDYERWFLYWASSVEGKYTETIQPGMKDYANNRMYGLWLSEKFEILTEAKILLNQGFITNDCQIFTANHPRGKYGMMVKHIYKPGVYAPLYLAFSNQLDGNYTIIEGEPISGDYEFCEGPTTIAIGDYYYCYFDLTNEHKMGCVRSDSLRTGAWYDITEQISLPDGTRHGTIIKIDAKYY